METKDFACNDCGKTCDSVMVDQSFDYEGPFGRATQHEYEPGSDCCGTDYTDSKFFMCKCGHEIQGHPDYMEDQICTACNRIGCWADNY